MGCYSCDGCQERGGSDRWSCGCCQYPNGILRVIPIQVLLSVGVVFASAAILDCELVLIDSAEYEEENGGFLNGAFNATDAPRGIGLLSFQGDDDACYFEHMGDTGVSGVTGTFSEYKEFTGSRFDQSRTFALVAVVFALSLWIWSLSFTCAAWPKAFRLAFAASHVLVVFVEGMVFIGLASDFCTDFDCEVGRTGALVVAATCLFAVSGLLAFTLKGYEGKYPAQYPSTPIHVEEEDEPFHEPVYATIVNGTPVQDTAAVSPGDPPTKPRDPDAYESTIPIVHVAIE